MTRQVRGCATVPLICQAHFLPSPWPEYKFAKPRKWAFDFAWPELMVALEVQGGLWTEGRHSRGAALLKEHEKLNAAACLGWRILFTTPEQVASGEIADTLVRALR
jgi:hypothetical protein